MSLSLSCLLLPLGSFELQGFIRVVAERTPQTPSTPFREFQLGLSLGHVYCLGLINPSTPFREFLDNTHTPHNCNALSINPSTPFREFRYGPYTAPITYDEPIELLLLPLGSF